MEVVEAELYRMVDEDILQNIFELHCCLCDQLITTFEWPQEFLRSTIAECPGCWCQTESITMNELVNTFVLQIN